MNVKAVTSLVVLSSIPSENPAQRHPQCPVCKADVSQRTMVPLYGRGQVTKTSEHEVPSNDMVIPERPPSLRRGGLITTTDSHSSQQPQAHDESNSTSIGGTTTNVLLHPMIGETSYAARVSGNSSPTLYPYPNSYHLAGSNTLRMRRHQLHADDKSLRRKYK
ncbi:E3 ubiquitin-protein ligase RMA1H1-like [Solanum dulcamara]|uniref:E3 ubiquitin-protein ligase RMA1H1-like n=1 Tax=Solanum dulcamara TaxID=45834 RepID=UPI00248662A7|nr:E3 ubiquitin-protein ligase RMA1H1-like [Solanum dulcamara]